MAAPGTFLGRAAADRQLGERLAAEGESAWAIATYFDSARQSAMALLAMNDRDSEAVSYESMLRALEEACPEAVPRLMALRSMWWRAMNLPGHAPDDSTVERARTRVASVERIVVERLRITSGEPGNA